MKRKKEDRKKIKLVRIKQGVTGTNEDQKWNLYWYSARQLKTAYAGPG
jgi:hypothetical protein